MHIPPDTQRLLSSLALSCTLLPAIPVFAQTAWQFDTHWQDKPANLSLTAEQQSRWQTLDGQFRAGFNGSDDAVETRTTVRAELTFNSFSLITELADMRALRADRDTPLDGSIVNPLDILQLNVKMPVTNILGWKNEGYVQVGRFTMDQGGRRLMARNRFRNTINAFAGALFSLRNDTQGIQLFYTLPTNRRSDGNLLDNKPKPDNESGDAQFWGIFHDIRLPGEAGHLETYLYGLDENRHAADPHQRNRLLTSGLRLFRNPLPGQWHHEAEMLLQRGKAPARAGTSERQSHRAHFVHLQAGYSFETLWQPRLSVIYDYATGDDNPLDNENNSFDSLYGVPRPDYGPTGTYRAFVRNNINTPGLQLDLKPANNMDAYIKLQNYRLDSAQQGWRTTRYQHPGGLGETRVGAQLETRLRWHLLGDNLTLETGYTWLNAGAYMDKVGKDDAHYFYLQSIIRL